MPYAAGSDSTISSFGRSGHTLADTIAREIPVPVVTDGLYNPWWYYKTSHAHQSRSITLPQKLASILSPRSMTDETKLFEAVETGDTCTVIRLLGRGVGIGIAHTDRQERLLLISAVRYNCEKIIRILLKEGADLEQLDRKGNTALHVAVMLRRAAIVGLLLDAGGTATTGEPLIHCAVRRGDGAVVRLFLERGVNVDLPDPEPGESPLLCAVKLGYRAIVALLVDGGANLEVCQVRSRDTALHIAVKLAHGAIVARLLDAGAIIDAHHEISGCTPLHTAVQLGLGVIVEILLDRGANIEARSKSSGGTPLHRAVQIHYESIIRFLLDRGDRTRGPLA